MKIVVTGGTGFAGKRVLSLLQGRGQIRCVTRDSEHFPIIEKQGFEPILADVKSKESILQAFRGCEGLINIVSLGFGDAENIVQAAEEAGILRAIFVSTTAVETRLNAKSKMLRLGAEEVIKKSKLKWTLLRPTMIYGGQDDRNIFRLLRLIRKMPLLFVPGSGEFLQQPVHVEDVAWAIVNAFFEKTTIEKTYNVSGAEAISFNQLIRETCQALGVKRMLWHLPITPVLWVCCMLEKFLAKPFLKEEQVLRLLEDKKFSNEEAHRDFGYTPRTFKEGILQMVHSCLY